MRKPVATARNMLRQWVSSGCISSLFLVATLSVVETSNAPRGVHLEIAKATVVPAFPLRLRGGRAQERCAPRSVPGEDGTGQRRTDRPLPDVGEAMKAKIAKHRQMRKPKHPDDPDEAKAKLMRKKQHDERRERRDGQRAAIVKDKSQIRKRRPFMRKRDSDRPASHVHRPPSLSSTKSKDVVKSMLPKASPGALQPGRAPDGSSRAGRKTLEGDEQGRTSKDKKIAAPMPARESILRPFWDPQAKGRDIVSVSPVLRKRARERLMQALLAVQHEHVRNQTGCGMHSEVHYALMRLVRGLAADSHAAADAFCDTLVTVLRAFTPKTLGVAERQPTGKKAGAAASAAAGGETGISRSGGWLTASDVFALMDEYLDDKAGSTDMKHTTVKGTGLSAKEVRHAVCISCRLRQQATCTAFSSLRATCSARRSHAATDLPSS